MASCRKQLLPGASVTRQTRLPWLSVNSSAGRLLPSVERLEDHGVVAIGPRLQVEEQPGRARDLVGEAATHAHRDIESCLGMRGMEANHQQSTYGSVDKAKFASLTLRLDGGRGLRTISCYRSVSAVQSCRHQI